MCCCALSPNWCSAVHSVVKPRKYRRLWSFTAFMMRRSLRCHQTGDALMFRQEGEFEGLTPLLQRLVQVQRVLVVSANPKDARDLEAKLARHSAVVRVSHVLVPKVNSLWSSRRAVHPAQIPTSATGYSTFVCGPRWQMLGPRPVGALAHI